MAVIPKRRDVGSSPTAGAYEASGKNIFGAFFILAMSYSLYILYSKKIDRYYIGISENPRQRLISHNIYPKGWTA